MRLKILIFIGLIISFILPTIARAQENGGVEVIPAIIDEQARARDILEYEIKIKNNSEQKKDLYTLVNDVSITAGRQEFLSPGKSDRTVSVANWIRISRGVIELNPGEETTASLKIEISPYASPGKRYAIITFAQGANRADAEKRMKITKQAELLINVDIKEEIIEKAQINSFKTSKSTYLERPIIFSLELENFGNRVINPTGAIYIYNRRGEEIDYITLSGDEARLAPGEKKAFEKIWDNDRGLGKLKARVEIEYGQNNKRDLQDTIYFWIMPWPLLLIFGGGALFLVIIITFLLFKKTYHNQGRDRLKAVVHGVLDLRDKK